MKQLMQSRNLSPSRSHRSKAAGGVQLKELRQFISETFEMSFMKHLCDDMQHQFVALILHGSPTLSEYILAMIIHGKSNVNLTSLLISKSYVLAMIFSLVEYIVEIYFSPALKEHWWISNAGLAMVVVGEITRKLAIITAGRSFTHLIKVYHEEHHTLVTHGVYKYVRHPGYSGFFIWAVGTQIMLCNPLSTVAFSIVVWKFFASRIPYEEFFLRQFFGSRYDEYSRTVPCGIPFVS
ncbi:OLC1v1013870C1 [Oldenlandia corymbosa var. corymbosa]|uniref:Protein-S-isoprenylcysteine O-methyltransferase n=1 Tax=Oldenlandia corymbosa var. corymbosa TaxID=529605 RepID=A0AAV1E1G4_OLDCO|nr:OLC1v1013870C1 [Oldenlandia corymbosa var. corymbosa]